MKLPRNVSDERLPISFDTGIGKPYPAYKPSGVEWLGEVPAHWEVRRLRNVAKTYFSNVDKLSKDGERPVRLCNYSDVYYNNCIRNDLDFMSATATAEEVEKFRLHIGDVLITKDSESWNDIGVPAFVQSTDHDIVCGYHLALLRPFLGRISGNFLCHTLLSQGVASQFFVKANGVTRFGLSQAAIRSVWLPLPPLPEQTAIARFLDYMDQRITRYIGAKEKLIALLEEYRQVVVSDAVTGRFDVGAGKPYPAYKPSGVEWLGEVPAHWEVIPNRATFSEVKAREHPQEQMLSVTISEGVIRQEELLQDMSKKDSSRLDKSEYKLVEPGDVAYNKMRAWQGAIGISKYRGIISPAYVVQRPRVGAHSRYLHHLLRTPEFSKEAGRCSYGIASDMWSLRPEHFKMIYGCLPPLAEQIAIARFLDQKTGKIENSIAQAKREIDLLREYRARLIADVVTGNRDVREVVAKLPACQ